MTGRRVATLVALVVAVTAMRHDGAGARSPVTSTPWAVEYAGCATVLAGQVCVPTPERQLEIWWPGTSDAPLRVAGARTVGSAVPVQAGRRLRLALDRGAERLTIVGPDGHFDLRLADEPPPPWSEELPALLRAGDLDRATALVQTYAQAASSAERGRALGALARIELRRGRGPAAAVLLRRALLEHRRHGRPLDLVNDTTVLVYTLLFQERGFEEGRALLEGLREARQASAEAAYYVDYYNGLLALVTGDVRSALPALGEAARRAERVGLVRLQRAAEQVLAEPLQQLGRRAEAEALLERLGREAPADLPACERGQLLNTLGWNRLLIREQGEQGPDPLPVLRDARSNLLAGCAGLADERWNVDLNIALAHLQAGDARAAQVALARDPMPATPALHLVLWQHEIEARLALQQGRPRLALARYEQLERLAAATLTWGARWRAALGRAQAWRALGDSVAALAAYAAAEDRLDDDTLTVPLQEGRESFVVGHERATRAHLELLLEQGRLQQAWTLARRSQARIVSALERGERLASLSPAQRRNWDLTLSLYRAQRDVLAAAAGEDWRLPSDRLQALGAQRRATQRALEQLLDRAFAVLQGGRARQIGSARAPRAHEALLAFHPLPRGHAGFLMDTQGLHVERLDCRVEAGHSPRLGACLLGPFAERLRAVQHVTFLPYGELGAVDLQALPFDGETLLDGRSASWSLTLGAPVVSSEPAHPTAVLVGDPRGDLPAARRELVAVGRALERSGKPWRILQLQGAQASYGQVRGHLPRADLFHFAGHGQFAGRGGWDSVLPLAHDAVLALGDVLALERAPRLVVLAGCETGRTTYDGAQALGLAQAFLMRGSEAVLAATRSVDDVTTAALVERFYVALAAGQTPAVALRQAQLALRRADGRADWAAFRLLEP